MDLNDLRHYNEERDKELATVRKQKISDEIVQDFTQTKDKKLMWKNWHLWKNLKLYRKLLREYFLLKKKYNELYVPAVEKQNAWRREDYQRQLRLIANYDDEVVKIRKHNKSIDGGYLATKKKIDREFSKAYGQYVKKKFDYEKRIKRRDAEYKRDMAAGISRADRYAYTQSLILYKQDYERRIKKYIPDSAEYGDKFEAYGSMQLQCWKNLTHIPSFQKAGYTKIGKIQTVARCVGPSPSSKSFKLTEANELEYDESTDAQKARKPQILRQQNWTDSSTDQTRTKWPIGKQDPMKGYDSYFGRKSPFGILRSWNQLSSGGNRYKYNWHGKEGVRGLTSGGARNLSVNTAYLIWYPFGPSYAPPKQSRVFIDNPDLKVDRTTHAELALIPDTDAYRFQPAKYGWGGVANNGRGLVQSETSQAGTKEWFMFFKPFYVDPKIKTGYVDGAFGWQGAAGIQYLVFLNGKPLYKNDEFPEGTLHFYPDGWSTGGNRDSYAQGGYNWGKKKTVGKGTPDGKARPYTTRIQCDLQPGFNNVIVMARNMRAGNVGFEFCITSRPDNKGQLLVKSDLNWWVFKQNVNAKEFFDIQGKYSDVPWLNRKHSQPKKQQVLYRPLETKQAKPGYYGGIEARHLTNDGKNQDRYGYSDGGRYDGGLFTRHILPETIEPYAPDDSASKDRFKLEGLQLPKWLLEETDFWAEFKPNQGEEAEEFNSPIHVAKKVKTIRIAKQESIYESVDIANSATPSPLYLNQILVFSTKDPENNLTSAAKSSTSDGYSINHTPQMAAEMFKPGDKAFISSGNGIPKKWSGTPKQMTAFNYQPQQMGSLASVSGSFFAPPPRNKSDYKDKSIRDLGLKRSDYQYFELTLNDPVQIYKIVLHIDSAYFRNQMAHTRFEFFDEDGKLVYNSNHDLNMVKEVSTFVFNKPTYDDLNKPTAPTRGKYPEMPDFIKIPAKPSEAKMKAFVVPNQALLDKMTRLNERLIRVTNKLKNIYEKHEENETMSIYGNNQKDRMNDIFRNMSLLVDDRDRLENQLRDFTTNLADQKQAKLETVSHRWQYMIYFVMVMLLVLYTIFYLSDPKFNMNYTSFISWTIIILTTVAVFTGIMNTNIFYCLLIIVCVMLYYFMYHVDKALSLSRD
tara:strand:- start:6715 stop:10116 length:3402 start_codon:yes stop_codon:yes gene_type:complete